MLLPQFSGAGGGDCCGGYEWNGEGDQSVLQLFVENNTKQF